MPASVLGAAAGEIQGAARPMGGFGSSFFTGGNMRVPNPPGASGACPTCKGTGVAPGGASNTRSPIDALRSMIQGK